jgi:hypothetical protein
VVYGAAKTPILLLLLASALSACDSSVLTLQVSLRGPEDACHSFVESDVVVVIVFESIQLSELEAVEWHIERGVGAEFSFYWPDRVDDGEPGKAAFVASAGRYQALGGSDFTARPSEDVVVAIEATCWETGP